MWNVARTRWMVATIVESDKRPFAWSQRGALERRSRRQNLRNLHQKFQWTPSKLSWVSGTGEMLPATLSRWNNGQVGDCGSGIGAFSAPVACSCHIDNGHAPPQSPSPRLPQRMGHAYVIQIELHSEVFTRARSGQRNRDLKSLSVLFFTLWTYYACGREW